MLRLDGASECEFVRILLKVFARALDGSPEVFLLVSGLLHQVSLLPYEGNPPPMLHVCTDPSSQC